MNRRQFLETATAGAAILPLSTRTFAADATVTPTAAPTGTLVQEKPHTSPDAMPRNTPHMIEADGRLRFDFGEQRMVMDGGLQPFMLATKDGTLIVQVQSPNPPFDTPRMHYPYAMWTVVSRDGGKTWTRQPIPPGDNWFNNEGGMVQLRDGTILGLDTYVVPGAREGVGLGQLYTSRDDWRTVGKAEEAVFDLPNVNFRASKDDGGHPHEAQRLHRRILELPNGELLTTLYGQYYGDATPATYQPLMMKARVMLLRSTDRGRNWKLVGTIAVDPSVGTEGFNEPVLERISQGPRAGRLLCFMRTGRELREAFSDDGGATWSPSRPRIFAGLDVHRTELWVDMFRHLKGRSGKLLDENNPDDLKGAVVDPDLIELRSGLLVATFGVRIPQKACWPHAYHQWNGNYLAVSRDHGESWTNVVRLTSGVLTTHYTGVEETPNDNEVFVVYDYGYWRQPSRYTYGRTVKITPKSA
jgi:hypothetical protein